jgi:tRNA pseudouridine55 synthase
MTRTVDGILNLNKPKGWTSHDVVAHVRRLTRARKVGHAGTLDPMATGVLLVCLGRATRITEYLMAGRKRYRADLRLGVSTDTHDADGTVTATAPVQVTREQVEAGLSRFRGRIQQVPPMVSAIKRDGRPLYELARQGIVVEREARPVEVLALTLEDWRPPDLTLEVSCSSGTYIRALARDLGQWLGCGAHLTALTRLASGDFSLSQAVPVEQFTAAVDAGQQDSANEARWTHLVMPMDAGLQQFPAFVFKAEQSRRIRSGQALPAEAVGVREAEFCRAYAAHDGEKKLIALLKFDPGAEAWQPHKVFHPL